MRGHRFHALAVALVVLAAAGSLPLLTSSSFSATTANSGNSFSAVPDWVPPAVSQAAIARTGGGSAGYIKSSATYYVYATATDSGAPASGISTIKADVSTVTTGQTAVPLVAGSYTAGGVSYTYRSAQLTANAGLASGSLAFSITATDVAGNSAPTAFSVTADNTGPSAIDVQATNVAGGTAGQPELDDTLTLTFSEPMDWTTILAGWTGSTTNVVARLVNGGGNTSDYMQVYTASGTLLPLGTVYLNDKAYLLGATGNYLEFGQQGGTLTRMTASGSTLSLVLGEAGGQAGTGPAVAMTWTPSALALDRAGNAMSVTTRTESGTLDKDF